MADIFMSQTRLIKDISDLEFLENVQIKDIEKLSFDILIKPKNGFWKSRNIIFNFKASNEYPFKPPKLNCKSKIFHPNINEKGNVCLNLIRLDWQPVFTVQHVIFGLIQLLEVL
ncbi:NEDD8-conjugating enzyme Ubc12 [Bonamia ostreae]|uniref:NEDD8-conjugating enzyme Ubc12 n=1 Tax=Bonamia ostreae TaxID=126728 RepID=A0ABV2AMN6_9EUKA